MRATHLKVLFSKNSRGHSNLLPLWMFSYCTIFLSYGKISLMSNEHMKIVRKPSEFNAKLNDLDANIVCNRLFCPACRQA